MNWRLFEKPLRSHETCVLVNNNLCGKVISAIELSLTLKCLKCYMESFYTNIILEQNKILELARDLSYVSSAR